MGESRAAKARLEPVRLAAGPEPEPLADSVYQALCQAISDSRYPAGHQLVQEQIAAELGVSRTPVREALMRLDRDGYARRVPGRGFVVRTLTAADVNEVYEVRRSLEPLALRLAFDHLRPRDLSRLRQLEAEMDSAAWTAGGYHELNRNFHHALIDRCPNRLLVRLIEQLWELPVMHLISHDFIDGFRDARSWRDQHTGIISAIEDDDDVDLAVRRLEDHLTTGIASGTHDGQAAIR